MISATVFKETKVAKVGLCLRKGPDGLLTVRQVSRDGLFAGTILQEGMSVTKINNTETHGKSLEEVTSLIRQTEGVLTVHAMPPLNSFSSSDTGHVVKVSIKKATPGAKVGIRLTKKYNQEGIFVQCVNEESPFASTALTKNMRILSVNGVSCCNDSTVQEVSILIRDAPRDVTIEATKDGWVESAQMKKSNSGFMIIEEYQEDSEPELAEDDEDAVLASFKAGKQMKPSKTVLVSATKPYRDSKVGLRLILSPIHHEEQAILIGSIRKDSLFRGSALKRGMKVNCINGVDSFGLSVNEACNLVREAKGVVTIEAEEINMNL